jgi:PAS domain S-box-containing protein
MVIKVLIVEDSEIDVFAIVRQLTKSNVEFSHASVDTAEDLKNLLETEHWDVVLSDFNIPGFGGMEALELIKELGYDIPFILISATIGEAAAVSIIKAGAYDYFMKGNLVKLAEVIKRAISDYKNKNEKKKFEAHSLRLTKIIESSLEIIISFEGSGKLTYLNKQALDIFGLAEGDSTEIELEDILTPDSYNNYLINIKNTIDEKTSWEGELMLNSINGTEIPVLCSIVRIEGLSHNEYSLIAIDISLRKKQENEILYLNSNLEKKVHERTYDLQKTNEVLVQKNREILESIQYALRIQKTILPKKKEFMGIFNNSFVLTIPRDIVSGDFYWAYEVDGLKLLAVIDCTGHGVPGAMLSILAMRLIHKIVNIERILEPSEILESIDREIQGMLQTSTSEHHHINDGMDMAICVVNESNQTINYAGANRPLFLLKNDTNDCIEYSPTKRPIGQNLKYKSSETFSKVELHYEKNDRIYLTSDGFQSQFGGPRDKKIGKKAMLGFLQELKSTPIIGQSFWLSNFFNDWKGNNPQVDDVCVLGVEL